MARTAAPAEHNVTEKPSGDERVTRKAGVSYASGRICFFKSFITPVDSFI